MQQSSLSASEDLILPSDETFTFDPSDADALSLDIRDFREEEGLEYPALLLSNVLFMDALKVLQASKRESYRTIDVWLDLEEEGSFHKIGSVQADSELLVTLRYLQIAATMYYSHDNFEALDLNSSDLLEKFV